MTYWTRGITLAVLLGITAPAGAIVLCAKTHKDGTFNSTVRIREVCRNKADGAERLHTAAALIPALQR